MHRPPNRPEVNRPEVNRPEVNRPEVNRPEVNRPEVNRPEVNRPEVNRPEVNRPEVNRPEVNRPEVNRPEVNRPEVNRPEVNRPEVNRPEVNRPEVNRPEVNRPEVNRPEVNRPEVNRPEVNRPEVNRPEVNRPEVNRPEVNRPEVNRPEVNRPEVNRPEVNRPEVNRPEVNRPEVNRPEVNRPEVNRPEVNRPEVNRPEVNRPEVNRPEVNRPEVNRPEVNRPEHHRPLSAAIALRGHAQWRVALWTLAALAISLWTIGRAAGQGPRVINIGEALKSEENVTRMVNALRSLIGAEDVSALQNREADIAKFYLRQYAAWKLTDPEQLAKLNENIGSIADLIRRGERNNTAGYRVAVGTFAQTLQAIGGGKDFSTPGRIVAILTLSRLNERGYDISGNQPPVPLRSTLPPLLAIYSDETNADAVRAAALQGLEHHVRFGFFNIPAENRAAIAAAMTTLIQSSPPEGRDRSAHAFLQRYAVQVLERLEPVTDAQAAKRTATRLVSLCDEAEDPDMIALFSAEKLGRLDKAIEGQVAEPEALLQSWAGRLLGTVDAELQRIDALTKPKQDPSQPPSPGSALTGKEDANAAAPMAGGMAMDAMDAMDGMDSMGMEDAMMGMGGMAMDGTAMDGMAMDGMVMDYMGGMGGMGVQTPVYNPQPPEIELSRRRIDHLLQQVMMGTVGSPVGDIAAELRGVLAAVPAPKRAVVTEFIDQLKALSTTFNDRTLDTREKWVAMLQDQRPAIGQLAGLEIEATDVEDAPEGPGIQFQGIPDMFNQPRGNAPAAAAPAAGAFEGL